MIDFIVEIACEAVDLLIDLVFEPMIAKFVRKKRKASKKKSGTERKRGRKYIRLKG